LGLALHVVDLRISPLCVLCIHNKGVTNVSHPRSRCSPIGIGGAGWIFAICVSSPRIHAWRYVAANVMQLGLGFSAIARLAGDYSVG
jgi:hypothetical protein